MKKEKIPLLLTWIRGAIGKEFVIKHYRYGVVKTKFPDMTRIIASAQQRKCRDLFKEAVAYAKTIIADPVKKKEWQKKVKIKYRVFNRVIKEYILASKEMKEQRLRIASRVIRKCFTIFPETEIIPKQELYCSNSLETQFNVETG